MQRHLTCALSALFVWSIPAISFAEETDELIGMSLAGLGDVTVTSVSKTEERAFRAAGSIFVINNEDIKRSGATTIPEILRIVPGLQVARTTSNKWAVSARGFNDGLANKLLVLIDGRSVYTPQFSGVFWDAQDVLFEDIDRIEVIRGPGSALWGANAVNGVINIITKSSSETQGAYLSGGYGNEEQGFSEARYGGKMGKAGHYRAYAKVFNRDEHRTTQNTPIGNDWKFARAGFRSDWQKGENDNFTLQGDAYSGEEELTLFIPSFTSPPTLDFEDTGNITGGNILGRWTHLFSNHSEGTLQMYFDNSQRHFRNIEININQFDVDYQQKWDITLRDQIVAGAAYRHIEDSFSNTQFFSYMPSQAKEDLVSGFIQYKRELLPEELTLTLGSKIEKNDYSGVDVLPNARLAWYPTPTQTLWGAVSRAVKTPSRSDNDVSLVVGAIPNTGEIRWLGSPYVQSEELTAYELGYRIQPMQNLSFDTTVFYHDYDELRTTELGAPFGNVVLPFYFATGAKGESIGIEFQADWYVTEEWELSLGYTGININVTPYPGSTDTVIERAEGKSPEHQLALRSHYSITDDLSYSAAFYYVDSLPVVNISSYTRVDSRIAWEPTDNVELELVGQNLFDAWHPEFSGGLNEQNAQVGRSVYGRATWRF